METNEEFLRDFILTQPEMMKFEDECNEIANKANSLANQSIKNFEEISKCQEDNRMVMQDYNESKEELTILLQKIESVKSQFGPKEMLKVLSQKQNEINSQSDKVRSQMKKKEISVEEFIEKFVKSKTEYYQIEVTKSKIT